MHELEDDWSVLPTLTNEERAILEAVGQSLRRRGWAKHVTVTHLVRKWCRFAGQIETTRALPEEFIDYLSTRDALEEALAECPRTLTAKLGDAINAADETFRNTTIEDGGRSVANIIRTPGVHWWWRRRPVRGPLSRQLDQYEKDTE